MTSRGFYRSHCDVFQSRDALKNEKVRLENVQVFVEERLKFETARCARTTLPPSGAVTRVMQSIVYSVERYDGVSETGFESWSVCAASTRLWAQNRTPPVSKNRSLARRGAKLLWVEGFSQHPRSAGCRVHWPQPIYREPDSMGATLFACFQPLACLSQPGIPHSNGSGSTDDSINPSSATEYVPDSS